MGLLDGLIGGAVGAGLTSVVTNLINQHGGVQGVINQLQTSGFGPAAQSWVASGPNHPVTPADMHQAFGSDTLAPLAAKLGISTQELAAKLSQVLPEAIDKLTPNGAVPPGKTV